LKAEDEMQLADNSAFLAHLQEGVESVTAVTIRETAHGLVICLASNHTPLNRIILEVSEVISLVNEYASTGKFKRSEGIL
jgi:hypothetical protein